MQLIDILIVTGSLVVLLLLWVIVGLRYLKGLEGNVKSDWEKIDELLRKRQDILPLLIETVRKHGNEEELTKNLIQKRIKAAKTYAPGANKIEYEHDLSRIINSVFSLGKSNENLEADTTFLELRTEIDKLEVNLENKNGEYNRKVRRFNKACSSFHLKPISVLFGFQKKQIFEVER